MQIERLAFLLRGGSSRGRGARPLPEEEGEADHLPRLRLHFNRKKVGLLRGLIDRLNEIAEEAAPARGNPSVATMSLGAGYWSFLNDQVDDLVSDGVAVVVAAGNNAADAICSDPDSQKKYPEWPVCTLTPGTWAAGKPCV